MGRALISAIICWKVYKIFNRYLRRKRVISSSNRAVVITGCDSGFGYGLVLKLNELGFYTIATGLNSNTDAFKQLTERAIFADKMIALELDVTNDSQIDTTFEQISHILKQNKLQFWALVNNAGVFHIGFIEWGNSIDPYKRLLDVNLLGAIRMTRKYGPLLRQSGGRVINVCSVASRLAIDGYSAYCVSKHALLAFNESLRKEMFRFGVKVISVEPSAYRTPIASIETISELQDKVWSESSPTVCEAYGVDHFKTFKASYAKQLKRSRDPIEVIDALIHAITSEEPEIRYRCCGLLASFIWSLAELLPTEVFDDIWRTISRFESISK